MTMKTILEKKRKREDDETQVVPAKRMSNESAIRKVCLITFNTFAFVTCTIDYYLHQFQIVVSNPNLLTIIKRIDRTKI